jgi:hypothetical protein
MGRKKGSIAPQDWLSGPDPVDHRLYNDCLKARAQAWYRGEQWSITEQEYIGLWRNDDNYKKKGRTRESLCMVRVDPEQPWTVDNVEIITRLEHLRNCGNLKKGTAYV